MFIGGRLDHIRWNRTAPEYSIVSLADRAWHLTTFLSPSAIVTKNRGSAHNCLHNSRNNTSPAWVRAAIGGCRHYCDGHQMEFTPEGLRDADAFPLALCDFAHMAPPADWCAWRRSLPSEAPEV